MSNKNNNKKYTSQVEEILDKDFVFLSYKESLSYPKLLLMQNWVEDKIKYIPSDNEYVIAGGSLGQIACLGSISLSADIDIFPLKPWTSSDVEVQDKHASLSMKDKIKILTDSASPLSKKSVLRWDVPFLKTKPEETDNSYNYLILTNELDETYKRCVSFIKPSVLERKYNMDNGSHTFKGTAGELLLSFDLINAMIAVDKYQNVLCHKHILSDRSKDLKISEYFFPISARTNCSEGYKGDDTSSPFKIEIKTNFYLSPLYSRVQKYLMKGFFVPFDQAILMLTSAQHKSEVFDAIYFQCHQAWKAEEASVYWSIFYYKFGDMNKHAVWWSTFDNLVLTSL